MMIKERREKQQDIGGERKVDEAMKKATFKKIKISANYPHHNDN